MKVSLGGTEIDIRPKRLLDYVEKVDFIKMRRGTVYELVSSFPATMSEENYKIAVAIAMRTVYTNSSAVSFEEELAFDKSEEGFFYELWRCLPAPARKAKQAAETWREGLNRARRLFDDATQEEQIAIRLAMNAQDESHLAKNSSGPNPEPELVMETGEQQQSALESQSP